METEKNKASILQMARGAIQERVDYEISRIVDNILDVNTEAGAKRKLVLTIEMKPDENRQYIKIAASAVSKLAPAVPVGTTLGIAAVGNGEMVLVESVPQVPGQLSMDGTEQETPKMQNAADCSHEITGGK
ncbi:MAG: hypothetical protein SOZ90_04270 [Candidatus Faecousia sp.]|nr:hypothetical protein [Candidatus Faecousia sp.]